LRRHEEIDRATGLIVIEDGTGQHATEDGAGIDIPTTTNGVLQGGPSSSICREHRVSK